MSDDERNLPAVPRLPLRIVDGSGKEIIRPDVVNAVTQLAQIAQLTRIRRALERPQIKGFTDQKILSATDKDQYVDLQETEPYEPYATAFIRNYGPGTVQVSINNALDWGDLNSGESQKLDFTQAERRIRLIYYKCYPGKTATVRVKGTY